MKDLQQGDSVNVTLADSHIAFGVFGSLTLQATVLAVLTAEYDVGPIEDGGCKVIEGETSVIVTYDLDGEPMMVSDTDPMFAGTVEKIV